LIFIKALEEFYHSSGKRREKLIGKNTFLFPTSAKVYFNPTELATRKTSLKEYNNIFFLSWMIFISQTLRKP